MKIAFLLDNAYGIGGTIRSTVNLSRALADRHTVEVVSLRRTARDPALPFDPRVAMTHLIDLRGDSRTYDGNDPLYRLPSERFTEGADHFERGIATRLGDVRVEQYLRETDADVVIGTRPKINDYLAAYGSDRHVRIGQEHLTHEMHSAHIRGHQDAAIARLDAYVTVSYADAANYREAIPGSLPGPGERDGVTPATAEAADGTGTVITCIPNAVPPTDVEPSDGDSRLIVAAGRLIKVKRYDRLLRAFALVAERHPDWRLRLYGRGRQQAALRETIDRLDLYDRAFLMGPRSPIETEWAKGAIAAVSSDAESFGMTLVEAMHCGVPVVSTDCPYGPGEIITNGRDGLLAPLGAEEFSVRAYADALLQLVENPDLRHRMGQAALHKAERYAPDRVAAEYEQLIETLAERQRSAPRTRAADSMAPVASPTPPASLSPAPAPAAKPGAKAAAKPDSPKAAGAGAAGKAQAASGASSGAAPQPFRRMLRRRAVRLLRPVLGPVVRRVRARRGQQGGGQPGAPKLRRPVARALARPDGSIVVRLKAAKLPKTESALLLRARGSHSAAPVRVPLPPRAEAVDGWVEVRLDHARHQLSEARWDAFVVRALDGNRKRIRVERVETARLLSMPAPLDADGALVPWVPYTTRDGYLAVRAWRRLGHAEVASLELGERGCTVRARLYGSAARGAEAVRAGSVLAVPRREAEREFELPVRAVDGEPADGAHLAFDVPYDVPAALDAGDAQGVWDLWFRPGGGREGEEGATRVRFGRLLGDLADRKKTDVLPRVRLGDSESGLWFYFSLGNDLVVSLQPLASEAYARSAVPAAASAPAADASAGSSAGPASGAPAGAGPVAEPAASASGDSGQGRGPSSSPSASASN